MVPLQVIILALVIVLYPDTPWRAASSPTSSWLILLMVLASHACLVWWIAQRARRAAAQLYSQADGSQVSHIAFAIERIMGLARWATIALALVQIWILGWGSLVLGSAANHGWDLGRYRWLLLPEIVFFTPPILSWLGFWAAQYNVEKALHQRALPYRLAQAMPAHEMPTLTNYLSMQLRHNFYLLAPVAAATLGAALASRFGAAWIQWVAPPLGILALILIVPWLVTRIWSTEPLTGPLRTRLVALAARHNVKFRQILLWKTHHHVRNAAVLGYMRYVRYFLLSDALLETLTDRQIEAVFAHEVGHGKHKHMWWYVLAISGAALLTQALGTLLIAALLHATHWHLGPYRDTLETATQMLLLGAFLIWGFSRISRRFEHQADWFAAQHMGQTLPDPEPTPDLRPVAPAVTIQAGTAISVALPPLSPEQRLQQGAEIFSAALRQIVELSHRSPDKGGWLHPSVRQRATLLRNLAQSPHDVARFENRMLSTRIVIALIFLSGLAACAALVMCAGS